MSFKHVFISHAGADAEVADWLAERLRDAGHQTQVDTRDLKLGDNFVAFMNDGIAQAHTVIILLSKHSKAAVWQLAEIEAAIWSEISQRGGQCIVVTLDDTEVPPLLGPKVAGKLERENPSSLRILVEKLCKSAQPDSKASVIELLRPGSRNPFRYLRAEFFEDRPDLHAKAFAPPDALTAGVLEEMKPCFLEGSRGTGKSMLLLSLRARNFLLRHHGDGEATRAFGFYLKLNEGAICNTGCVAKTDPDPLTSAGPYSAQIKDISEQEIIIQLIESLFSEFSFCIGVNLIKCDRSEERRFAENADKILFDTQNDRATTIEEVLEKLGDAHKKIAEFIRRKFIYKEQPGVPFATFDREQLNRMLKLIRRQFPILDKTMFVALLDEYENLFPYQQRIVNTLVKLGPPKFSVKVAKKLGSGHTSATTGEQWLEETHDYTRLPLVFDLENAEQRSSYQKLLSHIVTNIFRTEGLGDVDINQLLPEDPTPEVTEDRLVAEVVKLCRVTAHDFGALSEADRKERITYYGEAATYRVLLAAQGRRPLKRFSGFRELSFLSSGVIRYFQEIVGVAYHLSFGGVRPPSPIILPPAEQSRAVHFVSQHNLTTVSRNVEKYGETLKYFVLDLGDCLRHKLLKHSSEPEAARLTIVDPELLQDDDMELLRQILAVGVEEGVFQTKEGLPAYKPKHSSDPQPAEFNICRMYAPVLEISPRLRMRTSVQCAGLLDLLSKGGRAEAIRRLKNEMATTREPDAQRYLDFRSP